MSLLTSASGNEYRNSPISNVVINKNTVTFHNANGIHKVELASSVERIHFVNWLLS